MSKSIVIITAVLAMAVGLAATAIASLRAPFEPVSVEVAEVESRSVTDLDVALELWPLRPPTRGTS